MTEISDLEPDKYPDQELTISELKSMVQDLEAGNIELRSKLNLYLPILDKWNLTKDEQANDILAVIESAKIGRRVEYYLWILNQPVIVLLLTLTIGILIKYEISTPLDPFSLNSGTTWIIPVIISAIATFLSASNKAYENSQKKGDAMILADIKREITPWLDKLEERMIQRQKESDLIANQQRQESEARAEKQRQESEARAEKQRQENESRVNQQRQESDSRSEKQRTEFEARAQKQRDEDNARIARLFETIEQRLNKS
jgi:flagellar biosynthesis GTPase FlhF